MLHDSDAHPGLTNSILSRWAVAIGTGAPLEHYKYPAKKAHYVGIPIDTAFRPYTASERDGLKRSLGLNDKRPLIVVTGGGLGAKTLNEATKHVRDELTRSCSLLLISGTLHYAELRKKLGEDTKYFQLHAFIAKDIVSVLAAADIVVARAGATTLLELAALAKPTVIVPNPYLTGGHQLKNAAVYTKNGAGVIIHEEELIARPHALLDTVSALALNPKELARMSRAIHSFSRPEAARDMAKLILAAV